MGRSPPTPSAAGISVSSSRWSMRTTTTTIDRATPRWMWRTPCRRMMWAKSRAPRAQPSCRPRAAPGRAAYPSARRRSCARTRRGPRRRRPPRPCASSADDPGCRSPPSRSLSNPPVDGASTSRRPAFFSCLCAARRCSIPPPRGGTPRGVPIPRSSSSRARSVASRRAPLLFAIAFVSSAPLAKAKKLFGAHDLRARAASKKTSPTVRPMPGTRRDGAGDALDKGASSSRWEASGPGFRALAESRRPHGGRSCQRSCRW